MAKIPRIEQGDRPSATYSPTLDASVANMVGSLGDLSGEMLATATAAEQAERKALEAAALAKKQIVDASRLGVVTSEFESRSYEALAQLEKENAKTPERIPEEYKKVMEMHSKAIVDREDLDDNVKLAAVRDSSSTVSSGIRAAYNISSALQTKEVKGNITSAMNKTTNGAAYQPSAVAAQQYAEAQLAKLMPQMALVYGKGAKDEADKLRRDVAARYAAHAARNNPQQLAVELESSPFLLAMEDNDHKAAVAAADASYFKVNDIRNLDIVKAAFTDGETLAAGLGTDEFIGAAADKLKALNEEYEMARLGRDTDGRRMKPEDAKARAELLDQQMKRIQKLQAMNYKQLDSAGIDDADTMYKLTSKKDRIFTDINDTSEKENLNALLTLQDDLEAARDSKKITKASYDNLKKSVNDVYQGLVSKESGKYSFLSFLSAERAGGAELKEKFEGDYAGFSEEVRGRVWLEYTMEIQEAKKSGKVTPAMAIKLARKALSLKTGKEVPGAYD